jgi:hypothetical protein
LSQAIVVRDQVIGAIQDRLAVVEGRVNATEDHLQAVDATIEETRSDMQVIEVSIEAVGTTANAAYLANGDMAEQMLAMSEAMAGMGARLRDAGSNSPPFNPLALGSLTATKVCTEWEQKKGGCPAPPGRCRFAHP